VAALSPLIERPETRLRQSTKKAATADGRQAKRIKIEKATAIADARDAEQVAISSVVHQRDHLIGRRREFASGPRT